MQAERERVWVGPASEAVETELPVRETASIQNAQNHGLVVGVQETPVLSVKQAGNPAENGLSLEPDLPEQPTASEVWKKSAASLEGLF